MAATQSFDADDYLETRYKDVSAKDRVQFLLNGFHQVFQSLPYSLKILEYGSGPESNIVYLPLRMPRK